MDEFLRSIWWMLVSLSVLITVHEFGHFWVARRCGIKVLRFSVGFGRPIWSHTDRHGTEFTLAIIPLGGYVKMLDERAAPVSENAVAHAFNRQPVWRRIAVVVAGPLANILLCWLLLWVCFVIGQRDYSPRIGAVQGMAASAGLAAGDRILAIDDQPLSSHTEAVMQLVGDAMDHRDVRLTLARADQPARTVSLPLSRLPVGFDEQRVAEIAGITWKFAMTPVVVDGVTPGSHAEGHLLYGDQLTRIDHTPIVSPENLYQHIQLTGKQQRPVKLEVIRNNQPIAVELPPLPAKDGRWLMGIRLRNFPPPPFDSKHRYPPLAAISASASQTVHLAAESYKMFGRILTGHASIHNISGPVTMARIAGVTAARGADWFFYFLAVMSLSLAIVNLLPIPVLDGGHLLYYLIEVVRRRPLSAGAVAIGQYIGLAVLAGLMGLAFYNDILSLVSR